VRIGIFGGTFNPIHLGHLRAAEEIRERFDLKRVIFIAAAVPPHKEVKGGIPGEHRMEMVRLAISGNPHFSLSDIELKRPGKSYSIATIQFFRQKYGSDSEMFFILGMDAFLEIGTWKSFQELFSLCHFIVMTRPGFDKPFSASILPAEIADAFVYDERGDRFIHRNGYSIYLQEVTFLDISSTRIREEVSKGRSIGYLLPPEVERYIKRHHFYRAKGD
jgi:nicotinate-nucleotide adenylyltransferase